MLTVNFLKNEIKMIDLEKPTEILEKLNTNDVFDVGGLIAAYGGIIGTIRYLGTGKSNYAPA